VIVYSFAGNTCFAEYLTVVSCSANAVRELRDEFALADYAKKLICWILMNVKKYWKKCLFVLLNIR